MAIVVRFKLIYYRRHGSYATSDSTDQYWRAIQESMGGLILDPGRQAAVGGFN
jgi:hypothetical protein